MADIQFKRGSDTNLANLTGSDQPKSGEPIWVTDTEVLLLGSGSTDGDDMIPANSCLLGSGAPSADAEDYRGLFYYDYTDDDLYVSEHGGSGLNNYSWTKCGMNEVLELSDVNASPDGGGDGQVLVWDDTADEFIGGDFDDIKDGTTYQKVAASEVDASGYVTQINDGSDVVTASEAQGHIDSTSNPHTTDLQHVVSADGAISSGTIGVNSGATLAVASGATSTVADAPSNDSDIANKAYVDNVAAGLDSKPSVICATTAALTGTGLASTAQQITWDATEGPTTIDGVTLSNDDRILVKNETDGSGTLDGEDNGIYVRTSQDQWDRADDMDSWDEVPSAYTWVEEGTTNADSGFVCTSDAGGTIGTDDISFTQFTGGAAISGGTGLTKSGSTLHVGDGTVEVRNGIDFQADDLAVSDDNSTVYIDASGNVAVKSSATANQVLLSDGSSTTPSWGALPLGNSDAVSGQVGVANGGTGLSTVAKGSILVANTLDTITAIDGSGAGSTTCEAFAGYDSDTDTVVWTDTIDGGSVGGTLDGGTF